MRAAILFQASWIDHREHLGISARRELRYSVRLIDEENRRQFVSRGGLAVSVSSYETNGPGSILGVAIFPG